MKKHILIVTILAAVVSACSTGGPDAALPSPTGDAAVKKACREIAADILPVAPIKTGSIWYNEGVGSAADGLELLRMGFARASFTPTAENIVAAERLAANDSSRWSLAPLRAIAGKLTLEVAPRGDSKCAAFEREIEGQRSSTDPKASTDDPMKFWTDTRFPDAPPEGRNWCIATRDLPDASALVLNRSVTTTREGQSSVSVVIETLSDPSGNLLAKRTLVRMYRDAFPIGVSQVVTGCDGNLVGSTPEFWGPTGIALQPSAPPTLINR